MVPSNQCTQRTEPVTERTVKIVPHSFFFLLSNCMISTNLSSWLLICSSLKPHRLLSTSNNFVTGLLDFWTPEFSFGSFNNFYFPLKFSSRWNIIIIFSSNSLIITSFRSLNIYINATLKSPAAKNIWAVLKAVLLPSLKNPKYVLHFLIYLLVL